MNTSEILGDAKDISVGMRSTLAGTEQRDLTISRKLVEHTAATIEALAAEVERLTRELAEERRDRGIWSRVDAKGSEGLAVWYDGSENVVARDADDALAVWAEHSGCKPEEHDDFGDGDVFERVADDEEITIGLGEEGAGPKAKFAAKCWALINGRGWLCTENW
jgi:hypothetical protein